MAVGPGCRVGPIRKHSALFIITQFGREIAKVQGSRGRTVRIRADSPGYISVCGGSLRVWLFSRPGRYCVILIVGFELRTFINLSQTRPEWELFTIHTTLYPIHTTAKPNIDNGNIGLQIYMHCHGPNHHL